ncbi:ATP-dependent helicase, partial [Pseudomonas sp. HMWF031]
FIEITKGATDYHQFNRALRAIGSESSNKLGSISILSQHSAKGLTVKMAIIPACCETISPSIIPTKVTDLESERRVFYVAATRPREELLLMLPPDREFIKLSETEINTAPASHQEDVNYVSRFVYEMNIPGAKRISHAIHEGAGGDLDNSPSKLEFNQYLSRLGSFARVR